MRCPKGWRPGRDQIVQVPLGPRLVAGIVWDGEADKVNPDKLREITQVFDCPPVNAPMRRFIDWVAAYTLSPPGWWRAWRCGRLPPSIPSRRSMRSG
jgi:primosomal protein N' (replication factor Y)